MSRPLSGGPPGQSTVDDGGFQYERPPSDDPKRPSIADERPPARAPSPRAPPPRTLPSSRGGGGWGGGGSTKFQSGSLINAATKGEIDESDGSFDGPSNPMAPNGGGKRISPINKSLSFRGGHVPAPPASAALQPLGADGSGNAAMKYVLFMDPADLDIPARNNT
jgi:hypothetical protein